jgi:hypothetical protein
LVEAASLLPAELVLDQELKDRVKEVQSRTGQEAALRRLMQRYMDRPDVPVQEYAYLGQIPPWRHQALAYHWGVRTDVLYLAHKPGLGKTREGTDITRGKIDLGHVAPPENFWVPEHRSSDGKKVLPAHWAMRGGVLIVCPKIVMGTWQEEMRRWQGIDAIIINSYSRAKKIYRSGIAAWVHICTYDSLDVVEDNEYSGIIADEAHYLANEDTVRFGRALHLRAKARWAIAMSGTPVSNMLPSLWAQYFWLDGGRTLGASEEHFRKRYFSGTGRQLVAKEGSGELIARAISRVTYFLTMQEAFPGKPKKIQQVVRIPMTREQVLYYEKVRHQFVTDILAGTVTAEQINVRMLKLLQICQGFVIDDEDKVLEFTSAKLTAIREMLTGQGDLTDRRVVVWCQFRHDLTKVVRMLQQAGVPCLWIHGDIPDKERERVRDMWNSDHRYKVLVGMIQLGIGINLHAPHCVGEHGRPARCSTTIFYGVNWRVTQLEQAMDRVYRGDQVETCLYRYLLSEDIDGVLDDDGDPLRPMDGRVFDLLQIKLAQAAEVSEDSVDYVRYLLGCQ